MKKVLSLLLVVVMLCSVAVVSVNAENIELEFSDYFLKAVRAEYNDYSIEKDDITVLTAILKKAV